MIIHWIPAGALRGPGFNFYLDWTNFQFTYMSVNTESGNCHMTGFRWRWISRNPFKISFKSFWHDYKWNVIDEWCWDKSLVLVSRNDVEDDRGIITILPEMVRLYSSDKVYADVKKEC